MAATFYRNHLQMTPVQRRVMQSDKKVAEQTDKACQAGLDVTLSSTFNALCPVYKFMYDSTVCYLISAQ